MRPLVFVLVLLSIGCGSEPRRRGGGDDDDEPGTSGSPWYGGSTTSGGSGATTGGAPTSGEAHALCVDTINDYRAGLGLPPYERWVAVEDCSDAEAASDAQTGTPHGAFGSCGEWAQNECPGWAGTPEGMIVDCLAAMWAEGPGGGHHDNMAGDYARAACGFFVGADGAVWSVQNFQ